MARRKDSGGATAVACVAVQRLVMTDGSFVEPGARVDLAEDAAAVLVAQGSVRLVAEASQEPDVAAEEN